MTHVGGPGSNPGLPQLWRLVTLKPLKLQQCTLHFWKPPIFFYLDKRGQGLSYVLNTQKAFVKIPGFTIVSLLAGYISVWLSVSFLEYLAISAMWLFHFLGLYGYFNFFAVLLSLLFAYFAILAMLLFFYFAIFAILTKKAFLNFYSVRIQTFSQTFSVLLLLL